MNWLSVNRNGLGKASLEPREARFSIGLISDHESYLRLKLNASSGHGLDDAKSMMAAFDSINPGSRPRPVVADVCDISVGATSEARAYYAQVLLPKHFGPTAIVTSSVGQRLLGSFFVIVNRPAISVRFFTDEEEALRWLINEAAG